MDRVRKVIGCDYAYNQNIYGQGIGVAVLDTGISDHPDMADKIVGFKDFVNGKDHYYDDNGHGTHICGIIGGNGKSSNGKYMGVAPRCHLVVGKVLDHRGDGNSDDVIEGIDWVINNMKRYKIRILNISVGTTKEVESEEDSSLVKAVDKAWDNGLVVVVAAGNNGPNPGSIGCPGISRKVITVGAYDDDIYIAGRASKREYYSGRGPTSSCVCKPEVVAPGTQIYSCNYEYGKNKRFARYYTAKSGTSMATPIVSGAIALYLSKYPDLQNIDVKLKLLKSARQVKLPKNQQGWGMVDVGYMLKAN